MMDPVARVLDIARSQLGYVEQKTAQHPNGNVTKYWVELDMALQGQSWCAAFVSWCFKHAQVPLPAMDRAYGYMNCISATAWAQRHGRWFHSPQVGDIALYGERGLAHHTGIVESVNANGRDFVAIEGNTAVGNDTNGGAVMRRQRNVSWVVGFLRPDYAAWDAAPKEIDVQYNPPLTMKPWVASLKDPVTGGVWGVSADGDIYGVEGARYRREWDTVKSTAFAGHTVSHLELADPARGEDRDGHIFVVVDSNGNRYAP